MEKIARNVAFSVPLLAGITLAITWASLGRADAAADDPADSADAFPTETHDLLPHPSGRHVAYGRVDPDEKLAQPIAYSHMLHAGTLEIQCEYCHANARRSIHAGVPSTETCMNCHKMVDPTGRPELKKLKGYWDRQEPIPWVKVHDLPDFVYFSHKRHVKAGVDCTECHGDVKGTLTVGQRVKPLNMGWCLTCHKTHPSVDEHYGAQAELRRSELKDCYTCHK